MTISRYTSVINISLTRPRQLGFFKYIYGYDREDLRDEHALHTLQ